MLILTLNGRPLYVSRDIDVLKKEMIKSFKKTCEYSSFDIIETFEESDWCEVTYHTGIHYQTDTYRIETIEEIN